MDIESFLSGYLMNLDLSIYDAPSDGEFEKKN